MPCGRPAFVENRLKSRFSCENHATALRSKVARSTACVVQSGLPLKLDCAIAAAAVHIRNSVAISFFIALTFVALFVFEIPFDSNPRNLLIYRRRVILPKIKIVNFSIRVRELQWFIRSRDRIGDILHH